MVGDAPVLYVQYILSPGLAQDKIESKLDMLGQYTNMLSHKVGRAAKHE